MDEMFKLLREFYPPENLYLAEARNFSSTHASIDGTFVVPEDAIYTNELLNYVTAEQYVRCVSQLSYALVFLLCSYEDNMSLYGNKDDFRRMMLAGELRFRNLNLHFKKEVMKGESFELRAQLAQIRPIRRVKLAVADINIDGAVRATCNFVAPN